MSLSLSSLLNPSPDSEQRQSPSSSRRDSLPPIQYVQSPEQHHAPLSPSSSRSAHPPFAYPAATAQEAANALANLSTSPVSAPTQWHGYGPQNQYDLERRRSGERRPGSGYGEPAVHLPPPHSAGTGAPRKMSSPSLEQYQVASRSPEQRRASAISSAQSSFTLPPMQGLQRSDQSHNYETHLSHVSTTATASQMTQEQESSSAQSGMQTSHIEPAETFSDLVTPSLRKSLSTGIAREDQTGSSPAAIKQEAIPTPQPSSPIEARRSPDSDHHTLKAVASLKNEHGLRTQSPLRDASVPIPTTETAPNESQPTIPKKRPAPAKTKKGTATTTKKGPPAKKRKLDSKRDGTPMSQASRQPNGKGASLKGTPANSSPAPSTRSHSADPNEEMYEDDDEEEEGDDDADGDVYCICRKPDNGTFMIGCDGTCDDWFHGKCVGIEERDKNLIDKYLCPNCTKSGIGRTTWKRMCRRSGCRQPARVGKLKGGNRSKYCSDECGVLLFRAMVAKTRGREESGKGGAARRRSSITSSGHTTIEDDLGAKGGVLAAGEIKALLDASKDVGQFRQLGDGVLSPPATPDGQDRTEQNSKLADVDAQALQQIQTKKEDARHRHALLKERLKFVNMVKQAANRSATERDLKLKDYCGYDSRLEFTEEEFQAWRDSKAGQRALELDTLATEKADVEEKNVEGTDGKEDYDICDNSGKKKCSRHLEWAKLAVDDLRMEMGENSDRMRALDREEKTIRERAIFRAKAGNLSGEGTVEVHGLGISTEDTTGKADGALTPPKTATSAAVEVDDTMDSMVE